MRVPGIPYVQGRNDYTDWDGRKYGIAIHNTSNDASDEGEASYATRRTDGVSSHLYADDDSVTQSLDLDDRAGHAGSREGNDHSIAVEITGANGKSRQWWLDNVAWDRLGWVLAWIITNDPDYEHFEVRRASVEEMRRNPQVRAFYGHDDMRRAWGGTTHTDPGPSFPWDRLFSAVNKHLGEEDDMLRDERIKMRPWVAEKWGFETARADQHLSATYGFARLGYEAAVAAEAKLAALLAQQAGQDVAATVQALLDQAAVQERAERQAELGEVTEALGRAAEERSALAELVRQGQSGELEAAEVVRLMGEKLTAQTES